MPRSRTKLEGVGTISEPDSLPKVDVFPDSGELARGTAEEAKLVVDYFDILAQSLKKLRGLLGVKIGGEVIAEKLARIDIWRNSPDRLSHENAMAYLKSSYIPNGIDLDAALKKIPPEVTLSGTSQAGRLARLQQNEMLVLKAAHPDTELRLTDFSVSSAEDFRAEAIEDFRETAIDEDRIFPKVSAFNDENGFSFDIAAFCPRTLGRSDLDLFGLTEKDISPDTALKFKLFSIELSRKTLKERQGHRATYFIEQGAILVSDLLGVKGSLPNGKVFLASSLALLDGATIDEVRAYIDAMLTLLIPEKGESLVSDTNKVKGFVQEDFVSVDLRILAHKYGLTDEYAQIFSDILACQQVQNRSHLAPLVLQVWDSIIAEKMRGISVDELEAVIDNLRMASFGHGQGLLEKYLFQGRCFGSVKGVDVHNGDRENVSEDGCDFVKVDSRKGGKAAIEDSLEEIPPSDLVMALDSLHESANPSRVWQGLLDKVVPGGRLFVVDPVYLDSIDHLTPITTFVFDNTNFPESMKSLPDFLDLVGYATLKGFKVEMVRILPGTYFGYGDTFWRIAIILRKSTSTPKYHIPDEAREMTGTVEKPEDVFKMWPFNKIKPEDHPKLLNELQGDVVGVPYAVLCGEVVKALFPERRNLRSKGGHMIPEDSLKDPDALDGDSVVKQISDAAEGKMNAKLEAGIAQNLPYPFLKDFFARHGIVDADLDFTNVTSGGVRLLKKILRTIGIDLDLSKEPGWKKIAP